MSLPNAGLLFPGSDVHPTPNQRAEALTPNRATFPPTKTFAVVLPAINPA